eukprot:365440-Chlamydomonas_euryale.AAC.10
MWSLQEGDGACMSRACCKWVCRFRFANANADAPDGPSLARPWSEHMHPFHTSPPHIPSTPGDLPPARPWSPIWPPARRTGHSIVP